MLESLFRLLFNYRPVVFQQGEFRLVPSTGSYVAAVLVAVAIGATFLTYRAAKSKADARHRIVLAVMRTAILALVLFCLFRPVLVVKAAVPQQNFLGILIDDSRSMQIADLECGAARGLRQAGVRRPPTPRCSRRCPIGSCCGRSGSRTRPRASARARS